MEEPDVYVEDIYKPNRRIGKINFRFLCIFIILSPGFALLGGGILVQALLFRRSELAFGYPPEAYYPFAFGILMLIFSYFIFVICINRMRDTGKPVWYLLSSRSEKLVS